MSVLPCGHQFSGPTIKSLIAINDYKCPVCREKFSPQQVKWDEPTGVGKFQSEALEKFKNDVILTKSMNKVIEPESKTDETNPPKVLACTFHNDTKKITKIHILHQETEDKSSNILVSVLLDISGSMSLAIHKILRNFEVLQLIESMQTKYERQVELLFAAFNHMFSTVGKEYYFQKIDDIAEYRTTKELVMIVEKKIPSLKQPTDEPMPTSFCFDFKNKPLKSAQYLCAIRHILLRVGGTTEMSTAIQSFSNLIADNLSDKTIAVCITDGCADNPHRTLHNYKLMKEQVKFPVYILGCGDGINIGYLSQFEPTDKNLLMFDPDPTKVFRNFTNSNLCFQKITVTGNNYIDMISGQPLPRGVVGNTMYLLSDKETDDLKITNNKDEELSKKASAHFAFETDLQKDLYPVFVSNLFFASKSESEDRYFVFNCLIKAHNWLASYFNKPGPEIKRTIRLLKEKADDYKAGLKSHQIQRTTGLMTRAASQKIRSITGGRI